MDIQTKLGHLLIVGFRGTEPDEPEVKALRQCLDKDLIGGVLLFKHNIIDSNQLQRLNAFLRVPSINGHRPFIAIDQEGGRVLRLPWSEAFAEKNGGHFDRLQPAQVAARYTLADVETYYDAFAEWLHLHHFNLNFAPCADLDCHSEASIISKHGRSFSGDPEIVVGFCEQFIAAHRRLHIVPCLKHFPGHGFARGDTHLGMIDITQHWSRDELLPFAMLIRHKKVQLIMMSHLIHRGIDDTQPVGFSAKWVQEVLRGELGYQGAVVSDDLHMGAIYGSYGIEGAIAQSLQAGVNLLVFSNNPAANLSAQGLTFDPDLPQKLHATMASLLRCGAITKDQVEKSWQATSFF